MLTHNTLLFKCLRTKESVLCNWDSVMSPHFEIRCPVGLKISIFDLLLIF